MSHMLAESRKEEVHSMIFMLGFVHRSFEDFSAQGAFTIKALKQLKGLLQLYHFFIFTRETCYCAMLGRFTSVRALKRRITRIGTHVFYLGRMILGRREFRVRMFFFSRHT